ncbi:hypothetical protein I8N78_13220 [Klebsiella pneumoniae]|uniref:hypothetical protein n=1 Tax=Klebsiella pneumoniae TaxID=573 RepID=UPI0018DC4563|nr:hypothetical protein [Klebsiella pneumoniae]QPW00503.1 hypothetical protein I8N78_13220 [Klebsiella pneumoniae]
MNDITELALMKGQKVEAPYYLAECTECGKMYSSSKLIASSNYFDGDADCYCPHCNADDADIADLGSGEQPAVMAWNYQQARIDVLVEALEKAQQRIAELEQKHCGGALMERELAHSEVINKLMYEIDNRDSRIAELESRTVKLPKLKMLEDYLAEVAIEERKQILVGVKLEFHRALAAAGIKVEAE